MNPFDDAHKAPAFPVFYQKLKQASNKKVISFSVYGDRSVYLIGAEKNIDIAKKIYPDWICRFYCEKNISNLETLKRLADEGKCEVVVPDVPIFPMYWRYFAADDKNVSAVIFRDTDSLINFREQSAVNDWIASDKTMHTMHDCDAGHWSPVMGGMCGLKLPINFEMFKEIDSWSKNLRNHNFNYSDDQSFLSQKVLPLFENSLIDHHNNPSSSNFKNSIPFPDHDNITYGNFVGDRVSAFTLMKEDYMNIDSQKVFVVPHLGPDDHFTCKNAIQYLINSKEEVVLPARSSSELAVNYLFGGNQNVKIIIIDGDDDSIYKVFENEYKNTHQLVPFGIHGKTFSNIPWSDKLCFLQLGEPLEQKIFELNSSSNFSYDSLGDNYKKLKKTEEPIIESIKEDELISVVIPTYNRFNYVLKTIESINSQTYKNIEIIVVNDASTQEEYYNFDWRTTGANIIHLPKNSKELLGYPSTGRTINKGIDLCSGDYFATCDDDDVWLPNKLELQMKAMQESNCLMSATEGYIGFGSYDPLKKYDEYNSKYYFNVLSQIYKSKGSNLLDNGFPKIWNKEFLNIHNCIIACSVLIHKNIINKIGRKLEIKMGGTNIGGKHVHIDYEYWLRALDHTDCVYVNKPCVYYNLSHGDGQLYL